MNWIGENWKKDFNNGNMPSLNQIQNGLIAEARVQVNLAMGDVQDQSYVIVAQNNIQKTWEDLLKKVTVNDRDQPLKYHDNKNNHKGTLRDASSPVVAICLYIFQFESFCYKVLNHASRFKDTSKIPTMGPYGAALWHIINET